MEEVDVEVGAVEADVVEEVVVEVADVVEDRKTFYLYLFI